MGFWPSSLVSWMLVGWCWPNTSHMCSQRLQTPCLEEWATLMDIVHTKGHVEGLLLLGMMCVPWSDGIPCGDDPFLQVHMRAVAAKLISQSIYSCNPTAHRTPDYQHRKLPPKDHSPYRAPHPHTTFMRTQRRLRVILCMQLP